MSIEKFFQTFFFVLGLKKVPEVKMYQNNTKNGNLSLYSS